MVKKATAEEAKSVGSGARRVTIEQARDAIAAVDAVSCPGSGSLEREVHERAVAILKKYFEQETATGLLRVADMKRRARNWPPLRVWVEVNDGRVGLLTSREDVNRVLAATIEESAAKFCDLMDSDYPVPAGAEVDL